MPEDPPKYLPTNIERVFELLDNKLVTFGVPGALSFVGIAKVRENQWTEAGWCFAGAVGVWIAVKVGKKLAPKFDRLLDGLIDNTERSLSNGWSAMRSDFEGEYLRQQARLCEEFTSEGFNPDRTAIPLLEEVFVPLDLSGAFVSAQLPNDPALMSENLSIWDLLARSRHDRKFRQMIIQAKGGMGKTTLLRHVALIYGQRKQRRYRAPKLIPVLLRLRDWKDVLTQLKPPSLPKLITEFHVPSLSKNHPLTPPSQWADKLLERGSALVMLDGFDELPQGKRTEVSHWISEQMQEYPQSVFLLTSRPAGYKDYVAQRPAVPIFVNKFNSQQQEQFIRRWYLCQEKCCRSEKQVRQAKAVATERAENLIAQLQQRQEELGYMAENPLLLNMLVTFHRFNPTAELPRQRVELYRGICKLQLEDRPKARLIRMLLSFEKSQVILQRLALAMVHANQLKVERQKLLSFLGKHPTLQQEEVEPAEWLKQIVEVSELLVEREPGEYEFPHLSFQGFFASTLLAKPQDEKSFQRNARLVLQNWNNPAWRESVLLYTAQLSPKRLDQVIRAACKLGSEASELAAICLREYPRPEKLTPELLELLQTLDTVAQNSKYQTLETYLQNQQWQEADEETYRLMITTVGKEEGQWFDEKDLVNFPCEDLKTIDSLWVKYSKGHFGFSVQKKIYVECGANPDGKYPGDEIWEKFGARVGWRQDGKWLHYDRPNPSLSSPQGNFPLLCLNLWFEGVVNADGRLWSGFNSLTETCRL
jgi:predicted NACHT family NTPase